MAIQASGGKGGNVIGPALGSIDGDIAIFDGTTGKLLKDTNNLIKHLNIAYGNLTLTPVPPPSACVASLAGLGAGNVDNGAHVYAITFVTAIGETELGTASNIVTVVNNAVDGQVSLTGIPIGPAGQGVTQRKVYRTKTGGSSFYFLTTIANNVTVTYTDNTADAGLGVDDATFRSNDTQWIYVDGTKSGIITNSNTILGINSGVSVTTGSTLTFLGTGAGHLNTIGYDNTFVGYHSGFSNISGKENTFVGMVAGTNNTTGYENTIVGVYAGYLNTTGYQNTFVGVYAGYQNTIQYGNTFIGSYSGYSNIGGSKNTFVGEYSGFSNAGGSNNTFVGTYAGNDNTSGSNNTSIGYQSGYQNTTGVENTFLGYNSGYSNIGGSYNIFVGVGAGTNNTTGVQNTFVGYHSGFLNIGGIENTFVGNYAGNNNTAGYQNTFVGNYAGYTSTTGRSNTFVGYHSGNVITTGTNCVLIGYTADAGSNALVNSIAIGSGAVISNSNSWVIGKLGTKQNIFEGANAAMGTSNLGAGGTILVGNTLVTANSRIFLTTQVPGGVVGAVYISARVAATSFTIQSTNVADTSTVAWEIKEPA